VTYAPYLIAAYAVFVLVLAWDYLATRWQIRRELRSARLRAHRQAARKADAPTELVR
jgi:heme exporter protein D